MGLSPSGFSPVFSILFHKMLVINILWQLFFRGKWPILLNKQSPNALLPVGITDPSSWFFNKKSATGRHHAVRSRLKGSDRNCLFFGTISPKPTSVFV